MSRRALVTGGAGFIGSHVVDALAEKGWSILVIDDLSSGSEKNLEGAKARAVVELIKADLCSKETAEAVSNFKPEVIFHHAAQMNVRRSVTEPLFDADKNILGTINILDAAKEAGVKHFIFASTGGAIYGEQEFFPADEQHPISPECPYGVSKKCAELYLQYYAKHFPIRTTVLRYGNVYGPRQNPKGEAGVVAIFVQNILAGKPLKVNGDGKQTRDFVYVGDVVAANLLALESKSAEQFSVYNVGLGVESSVLDIVEAMKRSWKEIVSERGGSPEVEVTFAAALAGEQRRSVIDPTKIKRELGWQPQVQLLAGIDKTVRSFLQ